MSCQDENKNLQLIRENARKTFIQDMINGEFAAVEEFLTFSLLCVSAASCRRMKTSQHILIIHRQIYAKR